MAETFQEYAQRLRDFVGSKDPLQSMQQTAAELAKLVQNLPEGVAKKSPEPGKWSISEIVAHLADTELVSGFRLRAIAGGADGVPIIGYDQDLWADVGNYGSAKISDSLKTFLTIREANLRYLNRLPESAWSKYGVHSERGRETVRELVLLVAGHDVNHIGQIKRILSSAQAA